MNAHWAEQYGHQRIAQLHGEARGGHLVRAARAQAASVHAAAERVPTTAGALPARALSFRAAIGAIRVWARIALGRSHGHVVAPGGDQSHAASPARPVGRNTTEAAAVVVAHAGVSGPPRSARQDDDVG
jgi:hypothetical protein